MDNISNRIMQYNKHMQQQEDVKKDAKVAELEEATKAVKEDQKSLKQREKILKEERKASELKDRAETLQAQADLSELEYKIQQYKQTTLNEQSPQAETQGA